MSDSDPTEVRLGTHTYKAVPQRVAKVANQLPKAIASAFEEEGGHVGSMFELPLTSAYRVLQIFIDELMPEHEWRGYSEVAFQRLGEIGTRTLEIVDELEKEDLAKERRAELEAEQDELEKEASALYDPDKDKSPTLPEIRRAFEVVVPLNGVDQQLRDLLAPMLLNLFPSLGLLSSLTSPSGNGASASTSSSTSPQTSAASAA